MTKKRSVATIRRSVALPRRLVDQARERAPAELRTNLNRLVTTALQEYVARRKEREFEVAMEQMAADPQIRAESKAIFTEFSVTDADGIG